MWFTCQDYISKVFFTLIDANSLQKEFIYKENIVYALVEFRPNYNKKEDDFFLILVELLKFQIVLNLQPWVHCFSHIVFS